jgi:hypothetical protein
MAADRPPICDYEGSDYQAAFWEQGERAYEDRVEEIALKRLLPKEGISCWNRCGRWEKYTALQQFQTRCPADYFTSHNRPRKVGRSERYIYVAQMPTGCHLCSGASMPLPVARYTIWSPRRALNQVRQVLQLEVFILEFANKQNLKAILRYLLEDADLEPFHSRTGRIRQVEFRLSPPGCTGLVAGVRIFP